MHLMALLRSGACLTGKRSHVGCSDTTHALQVTELLTECGLYGLLTACGITPRLQHVCVVSLQSGMRLPAPPQVGLVLLGE